MRVAVVDMGTNSTRLLVAQIDDGRVDELERRSTVTRLGRGVDLSGQLSHEAIDAVCEAVRSYIDIYSELGVDVVRAMATSAVRDAGNGSAFLAELRERFGLNAQVLTGDEEARLTYLGATAERPARNRTLVIDIGGGSTELIVGHGDRMHFHASLQAGVVRHTERYISHDPPATEELEALAGNVRDLVAEALADRNGTEATEAIAVAGTPTSLAAIDQRLEPYDPERVHGYALPLTSIQRMCSQLSAVPLAERVGVPGLHEGRAPTIVAGIVILIQVMRAFGLEQVEISEHDILWGAALDAAAASTG